MVHTCYGGPYTVLPAFMLDLPVDLLGSFAHSRKLKVISSTLDYKASAIQSTSGCPPTGTLADEDAITQFHRCCAVPNVSPHWTPRTEVKEEKLKKVQWHTHLSLLLQLKKMESS